MKIKRNMLLVGLVVLFICLFALDVWAGPGGKIGKALFTTFWGKALLLALTIIFLPLVLYMRLRQYLKVRRTMKVLRALAGSDRNFDWMFLKNRFTDVFTRTHAAWGQEDMGAVSEFCTSWYWQNQQIVHLDRWKNQGLVNVSKLNSIHKMEPIFVRYTGHPQGEGSIVVVDFKASVEDYLIKRDSGMIVEGKKGFQNVETLWTFQLSEGKWLLENIEQVEFWSMYIKMPNEVPAAALSTQKG
jgi:hypothetical protein